MKNYLSVILTTFFSSACPGQVSVPIDDAWLACEVDEECEGVSNEQICFAGGCNRAAINADFRPDYQAAFAEHRESCLYIQSGDTSCDDPPAACIEGECQLVD